MVGLHVAYLLPTYIFPSERKAKDSCRIKFRDYSISKPIEDSSWCKGRPPGLVLGMLVDLTVAGEIGNGKTRFKGTLQENYRFSECSSSSRMMVMVVVTVGN